MARNLFELVSYGKLDFSRPDLYGNKPAKGKCLAGKARDKEVLFCSIEGHQFFFLFKLLLKVLVVCLYVLGTGCGRRL